ADHPRLRRAVLGGEPLPWPGWLGHWPAVALFVVVVLGELIFNATATRPAVTAVGLLVYALVTFLAALLFGAESWLRRGELFSVLFGTWGRLGWWRFGHPGRRGFGGGLAVGFEPTVSRVTFVLLLLVSVAYDGLLSTPAWQSLRANLPGSIAMGSPAYLTLESLALFVLAAIVWLLVLAFAEGVRRAGHLPVSGFATVCGLLPSLLPISFGYLLAHNAQYLATNLQDLIPLAGDPFGKGWHLLPAPFNDSYEINKNLLPSNVAWYIDVVVIVLVHIAAIVIAHRYLRGLARSPQTAQRAEWPWMAAMVGYTMTSLWLLSQPLVQEASANQAESWAAPPIRIGAVFPLTGPTAELARQELAGVDIARSLVDAQGGVGGRPVVLETRDVDSASGAGSAVAALHHEGVSTVIGSYSSELSMSVSQAAAREGMVYWEAGAVADQLTGRGLPRVFRVGATGSNLGGNSARFALEQLAPRLGKPPGDLTASLVVADDLYARSVADAASHTLTLAGTRIVSDSLYNPYAPDFRAALDAISTARPDILILASHIPDGIEFRRAFLTRHLTVGAFVGSTMAQCLPDFGAALGPDAIGVFASDRPGEGFNPAGLQPEARSLFDEFAGAWRQREGGEPTEEGVAGFSAGWALFHDVLPRSAGVDPDSVAAAAHRLDLPEGSLPNGAGILFSDDPARLGQNLRAAAVVWQWQGVRRSVVVWPPEYASGSLRMPAAPA
ncbi:MAG TPA: ABC transporter substrate-binding protein, partial [Candidatus Sulfotelmatobacter sp.]|nr:ABC transporter substrate-binding protein [Candidatus Sulfotelmatobacter sp.]